MAYEQTDPWQKTENLKICMTVQENFQQETMQVLKESINEFLYKLQVGKICNKIMSQ